jgi:hypothetical protein
MAEKLFFKQLRGYPVDREQGWSDELQGVSHDDDHWYISQRWKIWKIPFVVDLDSQIEADDPSRGIRSVSLSSRDLPGYNHFGDLDFWDGHLYVGVEDVDKKMKKGLAVVFNAKDLSFAGAAVLTAQGIDAPWCAVNKADGLLYSSNVDGVKCLYAYEQEVTARGLRVQFKNRLPLVRPNGRPFSLNSAQGGVFAEDGLFFLASNDDKTRGALVFRISPENKAVLVHHIKIDTDSGTIGEEIEGLTFCDHDDGRTPHIRGQLHVMELDNDVDRDDLLAFRHYRMERAPFIANRNPKCREVHHWDCKWVDRMLARNKLPYDNLDEALADGFDGCFYCLEQSHTR